MKCIVCDFTARCRLVLGSYSFLRGFKKKPGKSIMIADLYGEKIVITSLDSSMIYDDNY